MATLPETGRMLEAWGASHSQSVGTHLLSRLNVGVHGQVVSEVQYDPIKHAGNEPNPASLMGMVTGEDYVDLVIPRHPLNMRVVIHHDPADRLVPDYLRGAVQRKQQVAQEIGAALVESMGGMTDRAFLYMVGEPIDEVWGDRQIEVIEDTEDPLAAAEAAAEICGRGLSFIISDFKRLPLAKAGEADFEHTVGVKVNHPLEVCLPDGVKGRINLGGGYEPDISNAGERAEANQVLDARHQQILDRMDEIGLASAHIVTDKQAIEGIDATTADIAIAEALEQITHR